MRILTAITLVLTFIVIVLGAYTRLKDAGLGCPDWPGCFGTLTVPSSAEEIQDNFAEVEFSKHKAWIEVVHRMFAGSLGLVIFFLTFIDFRDSRRNNRKMSRLLIFTSLLVVAQSLLGMWTVTLQLLPQVVTAHLFGGFTIFSLLFLRLVHVYNYDRDTRMVSSPPPSSALSSSSGRTWIIACGYGGLALVIMQIFLGGWVSTNYASLACTDFPLCGGEWVPEADFVGGFDLLHPIGENYEGGVLDTQAQIAIHWAHRVGALLVTLFWVGFYLVARIKKLPLQDNLNIILGVLLLQIILGITNVLGDLPLLVATAHNAMAAILLLSVLWLLFCIHYQKSITQADPDR